MGTDCRKCTHPRAYVLLSTSWNGAQGARLSDYLGVRHV